MCSAISTCSRRQPGNLLQLGSTAQGDSATQRGDDGNVPYAGLIVDQSGNIYGAATGDGTGAGGTIFELTPSNGGWTFTVLYRIPYGKEAPASPIWGVGVSLLSDQIDRMGWPPASILGPIE
jgi:hypothetical protein